MFTPDADDSWLEAAASQFETSVGYSNDPALWVKEVLGEHLWSKQIEVVESLSANKKTAVRSAHGTGKSFLAARAMAWWIAVHPPGEAFIVSSAPSFSQVRAILWRELNKAYKKAEARGNPLPGRMNQTEWLIGKELIGYGRKPADLDPTGFVGIHAKYVLVVLDEAGGIPEALWVAADALATGAYCRILAIGNPDDPTSYFSKVFAPESSWNEIHISAFDSPNFTGEEVPIEIRDVLVSEQWATDMKKDFGEDSAYYQAKVLGEFPKESNDSVVRLTDVLRCQTVQDNTPSDLLPVELGVDVGASSGGDSTVIYERRGRKAGRKWEFKTADAMKIVGMIVQKINDTGATSVKIDVIGVGFGIAGRLRELGSGDDAVHKARIVDVDVRKSPSTEKGKLRLERLRDELWWDIGRVYSEKGLWDLSGVDPQTLTQLLAPKYEINSSGKTKVEAKDDTKKRIGRSPDAADALLLAFFTGRGSGAGWMAYLEGLLEQGSEPAMVALNAFRKTPDDIMTGARNGAA